MRRAVRRWLGLARSLVLYRRPAWHRRLMALYRPFVRPGDLVFDVGAHLGDRTRAFSALGARVVALEPQPHVFRWLDRAVRGDPRVVARREAVGAHPGTAEMAVSLRTPTVSSLSERWPADLPSVDPGFARVHWDDSIRVGVTTLDALMAEYGRPAFVKIDVEGHEAEVVDGLTRPLPALSLEFVLGAGEVAGEAIRRLQALGSYEFNAVRGEEGSFALERWADAEGIRAWLEAGADGAPSGDLFARLR